MEFRQAREQDMPEILAIIKQAKRYFKEQGIVSRISFNSYKLTSPIL